MSAFLTPSVRFTTPVSGTQVILSPQGNHVASIVGSRLMIKDALTLETLHVFSCIDRIEKVDFSPDSCYIYCAMLNRAAVQAFSLVDPEWKCRINEGLAGLINVAWTPDSRSLITESDFGIQLTIWSLIDNTSHAILHPKQPFVGGKNSTWSSLFSFSDCGKYLAVVHRIELQDHIGIYSTDPWSEQTKFKCKSNDVASINWVPNGTHIVTCDSPLSYKFCIYTPSGEIVGNYEAYHNALGIKNLTFYNNNTNDSINTNISSSLMAVGSYDGKIRLITMQSWQVAFILPLTHPRDMDAGIIEDPTVGAEVTVEINETSSEISISEKLGEKSEKGFPRKQILAPIYVKKFMKTLPRISIDARDNKSLPPMGPSWCSWSADGSYFACREESFPKVLWIWDSNKPKLIDIILQAEPITCAQWKPSTSSNSLLAFCTGSGRIYLWSLESSVSWVDLPSSSASSLAVSWLKWSNDGTRIVMGGRESFCTAEVEL